jgi:type I restriction enzyme S subunit
MNPDALLSHFDRISNAPDAISRLRRFIVDLAVRGKLVDQDPNDEPASQLLKRIQVAKSHLVKSGKLPKQKTLPPIDNHQAPFSLPQNWCWARLNDITSYIQRGKSPKYATDDGFLVVSQKCVQWRGLELEAARRITRESIQSYEEIRFLRDGDLLWNSTGTGTIGRIVRLDAPPARLVCDSHVTVVRCLEVDSEYIRSWLRSDGVYGSIENRAAGSTNQVELTSQMAISQIVPLPPLDEQRRIVSKLNELVILCDGLEAVDAERETRRDRLSAAAHHQINSEENAEAFCEHATFFIEHLSHLTVRPDQLKQLRQTILNLAVRGQLVSQDPNDEAASGLLKQIKVVSIGQGKITQKSKSPLPKMDLAQQPFKLPSGWTWARFPELGIFGRGKSKHRPRNDQSLFEEGTHLFVQTGDVARSHGHIETFTNKYNDYGLAQSAKWPKGTLCITIAANIADSGILSFDACFPDSVAQRALLPVRVVQLGGISRRARNHLMQHRHRHVAARRDAYFYSYPQDLAQRAAPEGIALQAAPLSALSRLHNRHQQRHNQLDPRADNAGPVERVLDEIAAPLARGGDDDEGVASACEPGVLLNKLAVSGLHAIHQAAHAEFEVFQQDPGSGAGRFRRSQFAKYEHRSKGHKKAKSVEGSPVKEGEIYIPGIVAADHCAERRIARVFVFAVA